MHSLPFFKSHSKNYRHMWHSILIWALAFFLVLIFVFEPSKAQNTATCVACHGENGIGTSPIFPNLAGQKQAYLRDSLIAYRSGLRKNEIMNPISQTLTDAEIESLAKYYSEMPLTGEPQ